MGDWTDILDGSLRNPSHVSLRQREQKTHTVIIREEDHLFHHHMSEDFRHSSIASLVDREEK